MFPGKRPFDLIAGKKEGNRNPGWAGDHSLLSRLRGANRPQATQSIFFQSVRRGDHPARVPVWRHWPGLPEHGSGLPNPPYSPWTMTTPGPWSSEQKNPVTTNISLVPIIKKIKKRGGRIIVINPFRNQTAALGKRHITPSPGMDAHLALAAAKILTERGAPSNRPEAFFQAPG